MGPLNEGFRLAVNAFPIEGVGRRRRRLAATGDRTELSGSGNGVMTFYGPNSKTSGAYVVDCAQTTIQNLLIDGLNLTSGDTVTFVNNGVGTCSFTTNPVSWTSQTAADVVPWTSVTYGVVGGQGIFIAVAEEDTTHLEGRVMSSTDGITWTDRIAAAPNAWSSVTYGAGKFVAVAGSGTNSPETLAMYSTDGGITWYMSSNDNPLPVSSTWTSVTYGDGTFVAVAISGNKRFAYSTDGINWTENTQSTDIHVPGWTSVTYGDGKFVAVASGGGGFNQIAYSTDGGINWEFSSGSGINDRAWTSVAYGGGTFVAVARSIDVGSGATLVATSANGIDWTIRTAAEANEWSSVTYGDGVFVAVASTGTNRVMYSADGGETWVAEDAAAANAWTSVTWGEGTFVAVSEDGTNRVMISGGAGSFRSGCTPTIVPGGGTIFLFFDGLWYCASEASNNNRRLARIPYSEAETYLRRALELYPPPLRNAQVG